MIRHPTTSPCDILRVRSHKHYLRSTTKVELPFPVLNVPENVQNRHRLYYSLYLHVDRRVARLLWINPEKSPSKFPCHFREQIYWRNSAKCCGENNFIIPFLHLLLSLCNWQEYIIQRFDKRKFSSAISRHPLYFRSLGNALFPWLVPSILADALTMYSRTSISSLIPFRKSDLEATKNHENLFIPPSLTTLLIYDVLCRGSRDVQRLTFLPHPLYLEAHSFLFIFADFLFNFAQTSSRRRRKNPLLSQINKNQRGQLFFHILFWKYYDRFIFPIYVWT